MATTPASTMESKAETRMYAVEFRSFAAARCTGHALDRADWQAA